jgi:hypothetical protein
MLMLMLMINLKDNIQLYLMFLMFLNKINDFINIIIRKM